jgi:hypothetical protein
MQNALTGSGCEDKDPYVEAAWVDYVLTTANTWKTPIKDFELIVERPKNPKAFAQERWMVCFCWDGPVKLLDADHFAAWSTNFVPKRELHVAFFGID